MGLKYSKIDQNESEFSTVDLPMDWVPLVFGCLSTSVDEAIAFRLSPMMALKSVTAAFNLEFECLYINL